MKKDNLNDTYFSEEEYLAATLGQELNDLRAWVRRCPSITGLQLTLNNTQSPLFKSIIQTEIDKRQGSK